MNNQANTENKEAASSASSLVQEITALLAKITTGDWTEYIYRPNAEFIAAAPRLLRLLTAEYETLQHQNTEFRILIGKLAMQLEAAEARAEAAEGLNRELGKGIEVMDAKLTRYGDGEWVTAYVVPAGPWHHILGIVRGNPKQAVPVSMQSSEERLEMGPEWPVRDAGEQHTPRSTRIANGECVCLPLPEPNAEDCPIHGGDAGERKQQHRCSGCGHRWDDIYEGFVLRGAELCGDCWRKAQPVVHAKNTDAGEGEQQKREAVLREFDLLLETVPRDSFRVLRDVRALIAGE